MKYILDGKKMVSKEETHKYLKETFGFPEYYGENLDALHDCLTEMEDLEVELLNADDMLSALGDYGKKLFKLLMIIK
ncbi:MAG: barstar family protein [Anaerotignum sp.]|nr:barstar family protein [Anaerotignum sp.]